RTIAFEYVIEQILLQLLRAQSRLEFAPPRRLLRGCRVAKASLCLDAGVEGERRLLEQLCEPQPVKQLSRLGLTGLVLMRGVGVRAEQPAGGQRKPSASDQLHNSSYFQDASSFKGGCATRGAMPGDDAVPCARGPATAYS